MISSYGDQSTTKGIAIIVQFTNAASIALNAYEHLMFYTWHYNIRVTHRNGAIKHIFYTNQIHGGCQQIVLYSFCRSMRLSSSSG